MEKTLQFDQSINIDLALRQIALEADFSNNLIESVKSLLPAVTDKILQLIPSLVNNDEDTENIKLVNEVTKNLKNNLKHFNFTDYDKTLVSVPEGFEGTFIEYGNYLNKLNSEIYSDCNKFLEEYNFVLSAFITNKENKISLKDHSDLFNRIQGRREEIVKDVTKFFPIGNSSTKRYLSTVINRFSDLEVIAKEVSIMDKTHNRQSLDNLKRNVDKTTDLLKIVIKNLREGESERVSGITASNLSKGAYEAAKFIELVSIMRFRTEQFIKAVTDDFALLDNLINKK